LWKDRSASSKAAAALKITAKDLLELGLVDEIIPEPLGGAHTDGAATAKNLKQVLLKHLEELKAMSVAERLEKRYGKFRAFGHFEEKQVAVADQAEVAAPAKESKAKAS
jgi:acetyl-CoA carboxylase carboxyl transferase subunit alpha